MSKITWVGVISCLRTREVEDTFLRVREAKYREKHIFIKSTHAATPVGAYNSEAIHLVARTVLRGRTCASTLAGGICDPKDSKLYHLFEFVRWLFFALYLLTHPPRGAAFFRKYGQPHERLCSLSVSVLFRVCFGIANEIHFTSEERTPQRSPPG